MLRDLMSFDTIFGGRVRFHVRIPSPSTSSWITPNVTLPSGCRSCWRKEVTNILACVCLRLRFQIKGATDMQDAVAARGRGGPSSSPTYGRVGGVEGGGGALPRLFGHELLYEHPEILLSAVSSEAAAVESIAHRLQLRQIDNLDWDWPIFRTG